MTTTARARDTPGRAPIPRQVDGLLVIDAETHRAHYECHRPGCPNPREEPIRPAAINRFIDGITARHQRQFHGEHR
ncbi:hypothetical protein ACN6K6_000650 [Streptomyces violaceoruber]|uniref:hypothetical protein n=1 Tax=Streptomyces violaceoruber TaxID=1935 RepID=UPI00403D2FA4